MKGWGKKIKKNGREVVRERGVRGEGGANGAAVERGLDAAWRRLARWTTLCGEKETCKLRLRDMARGHLHSNYHWTRAGPGW